MARPEVSVIICVRNGARTIRRQLDALDAQVDHPPFEVIVVDNGSTDDTVAVVERWLRERGPVDAPGHLVDASTRPGIPYARNQGALAARGRLLAYCDADDRVHPRWVGAMHRALARDGIVGGRIEGISPSGKPLPHTFPHGLNVTEYLPHDETATSRSRALASSPSADTTSHCLATGSRTSTYAGARRNRASRFTTRVTRSCTSPSPRRLRRSARSTSSPKGASPWPDATPLPSRVSPSPVRCSIWARTWPPSRGA